MKALTIYLVRVEDEARAVTVMEGMTVAAGMRAAARQMCLARFGKWTGASAVLVEAVGSGLRERFDFSAVAPSDFD